MQDTLMSVQIVPKTPNNDDVIPYVDEAIKIIDQSGLHYRVGPCLLYTSPSPRD